MSHSYDLGQRTPRRPFPLLSWLLVVLLLAVAAVLVLRHVVQQESTQIQNAAPVTRTVTVPSR